MTDKKLLLESVKSAYIGKIPTRSDGYKRRKKIILATQTIILDKGIQGVRHRAVAELAQVPLASTTYYFKDINALLHDTALDFYEYVLLPQAEVLVDSAYQFFEGIEKLESISENELIVIKGEMVNILFTHMTNEQEQYVDSMLEYTFRNESLRNQALAKVISSIELFIVKAISKVFEILGSNQPLHDSRILMSILLYLQYNLLVEADTPDETYQTIENLVNKLI